MKIRDIIGGRIYAATDATAEQAIAITANIMADLEAAGLVIMPAVATNRMRHEACKGAVGITTGTFGLMWSHIVAYCRTLEREP